jgi:hypothetical protein
MAKVVLNGCYGGYGLSTLAMVEVLKRKGKTPYVFKKEFGTEEKVLCETENYEERENGKHYFFYVYDNKEMNYDGYYSDYDFERNDPDVIAVVEELGDKANGYCASLFIDEYDDENFTYWIDEYDGIESLMLEPVVSEKRLAECKSTKEIVEYLESININVKTA